MTFRAEKNEQRNESEEEEESWREIGSKMEYDI